MYARIRDHMTPNERAVRGPMTLAGPRGPWRWPQRPMAPAPERIRGPADALLQAEVSRLETRLEELRTPGGNYPVSRGGQHVSPKGVGDMGGGNPNSGIEGHSREGAPFPP